MAAVFGAWLATADSPRARSLEQRVAQLEQQVAQLEDRLNQSPPSAEWFALLEERMGNQEAAFQSWVDCFAQQIGWFYLAFGNVYVDRMVIFDDILYQNAYHYNP
jgi:hypothetical protein